MQYINLTCKCGFNTCALISNNILKTDIKCFKCKHILAKVTIGCNILDCKETFFMTNESKICDICSNEFIITKEYLCPKHGNINVYKKTICMRCDNVINYIMKNVHGISCRKNIFDVEIYREYQLKIRYLKMGSFFSVRYPLLKIFTADDTDETNCFDLNNIYIKQFYFPSDLFKTDYDVLKNTKIVKAEVVKIKRKFLF